MANIKRNIRYYQPNDPYYWEVDNLPLTDLLSNDVVLENRVNELEALLAGFGAPSNKGKVSLNSISDLKAWAEPLSGTSSDFGKIFVRPGKFISRMQLPATRESGWRMMRDESSLFNNEEFLHQGTNMLDTTTLTPFARESRGVARTALVEFYANMDGSDKSIAIDSFNAEDFNEGAAPYERLDLIYIKGTKSLDTDGDSSTAVPTHFQDSLSSASLGVIKGAYFRTDRAGGVRTNGTRFLNPLSRTSGRTTGMSMAELPRNTSLPGFGTVPMPEDLNNFAWHSTNSTTATALAALQVTTQASFSVPVAYVRVPSNYTVGDPISPDRIIDIRPFFRSAELTGSERQAVASSWDPNGDNPFMTRSHFLSFYTPLESRVSSAENNIASNAGSIDVNKSQIFTLNDSVSTLELSVSGTGTQPTHSSLNHEGRIVSLESAAGGGSGGGGTTLPTEHTMFLSEPYTVFSWQLQSSLGSSASPRQWVISGIPASDAPNVVAVQFVVKSDGQSSDTDEVNIVQMSGGVQNMHPVSMWGVAQANGDLRRNAGSFNTFMHDVDIVTTPTGAQCVIHTAVDQGSSDVRHSIYVTGYIVSR